MMDWRFGLARFSERNIDGFVTVQPDWYGDDAEDDGGGEALEVIHPYGFRSQPRDPDVDPETKAAKGAGLLYVFDGDEGFALPTQDPRHAALLSNEQKGGAQMYGVNDAGQLSSVIIIGTTGDITTTHGGGMQSAMSSTEMVFGTGTAVALAKGPALDALLAALATFATAMSTAANFAQTAAAATALQGSLQAITQTSTTKVRAE
jgi:hypothetical protein